MEMCRGYSGGQNILEMTTSPGQYLFWFSFVSVLDKTFRLNLNNTHYFTEDTFTARVHSFYNTMSFVCLQIIVTQFSIILKDRTSPVRKYLYVCLTIIARNNVIQSNIILYYHYHCTFSKCR